MHDEEDKELARRFASRGGHARAKKLSKAKLRAIGRKAGKASGKARRKKAKAKAKEKKKLEKMKKPPEPGLG